MFRKIKAWLRMWNSPAHVLVEEHLLLVLAARRCAYDLKHAASELERYDASDNYSDRCEMWLNIFTPDGTKIYRSRFHREINQLERDIEKYKKVLEENGIKYDPDVPF